MLMGQHYQNAYVTRNVDKAVATFRERADVRSLMEIEVPITLWTPQGSGTGVQKLALLWIEDQNIELIEPKEGDVLAIYRGALPEHDGLAFHHACYKVDHWNDFLARVGNQPAPLVLRGGTPGMLEFAYLDTRDWLGHYTEYVWMSPERWAQMGGR